MATRKQLNILSEHSVPINQDFIITLIKDSKENIDKEARRTCKILKFSSNWNSDDILTKIYKLDPKNLPNLFTFIIEVEKIETFNAARITEKLVRFGKNRPIIFQINSDDSVPVEDRKTKIFFKEENSDEFLDTKGQKVTTTKSFYNFSTFLWLCMNEQPKNIEKHVLKKLSKAKHSSLILKFIKLLKLSDEFFNELVLKYAANGSKSDFIITVDGFINDKGKLDFIEPKFITETLIDYKSALFVAIQNSNKEVIDILIKKCPNLIQQLPFEHQVDISAAALSTNQISILCDLLNIADFPFPDDPKTLKTTTDKQLRRIIAGRIKFHKDVQAENTSEIKKFIAENPNIKFVYSLKNKSALSQALYSTKFEIFFLLKSNRFRNNEIENFDDDLDEVEDKNKARTLAAVQRRKNVDSSTPDKDKSVLLLATRSFIYNRNDENKAEEEQREKIRKWYKDIDKSKLGSKLIDVASQCNDLKLIFDFECDSVENIDVSKSQIVQGTTYPKSKWIFIGAKLTEDNKREQEIKGVIAHEICHLVMRLVYQNNESPYYKDNVEAYKEFDVIVNEIESMLFPEQQEKDTVDAEDSDKDEDDEFEKAINEELGIENNKDDSATNDECDGVISSVYKSYPKEHYHVELIVRPVQIQTQFDDEPERVAKLEAKYKKLFEFCEKVILPELQKFNLKQRGTVKNFNNFVGFLTEIQSLNIELSTVKDMTAMMNNNLVILTSNVPKLLKLNIYKFLQQKCGDLMGVQNIFVESKRLQNYFVVKNFKEILQEQKSLSVFVDCSVGFLRIIDFITSSDQLKFIFIVSNDHDCLELKKKMKEKSLRPYVLDLKYNWEDLTAESQRVLLNTEVNFQNNSNISLYELISNKIDSKDQESLMAEDFSDVIDDQLLNLLLEKSTVEIDAQVKEELNEIKFKTLFQPRKFIKSYKIAKFSISNDVSEIMIEKRGQTLTRSSLRLLKSRLSRQISKEPSTPIQEEIETRDSKIQQGNYEVVEMSDEISQQQLLDDVKTRKYVLISEKAGSGKSWILKNLTNNLKEKYPKNWITYIDMKQFIPVFKSKCLMEFEKFMTEKILKLKTKYEAKIFQKLYKNGKVCILFDGFDEIAPDCAEFVTKLFKSFQQNGGNQLWIATRDYFESDLKKDLELGAAYKLCKFSLQDGVMLIVFSWILREIFNNYDSQSEDEIKEKIQKSPNFEKYKEIAVKLSEKVPETHTASIGLPQFYKIIADVSLDNKESVKNHTTYKLFEECVNIQYEKWSRGKGDLIRQESILSQRKELNFHKLHQLIALKSLFPKDSKFCDLDLKDLIDWADQQMVACGMLNKIDDKIFFSQQTIREFYAADFILRVLIKPGSEQIENLCCYLTKFLTIQKFMIIRMFLNEGLQERSIFDKIESKIPKIANYFCSNAEEFENLSNIFDENLGNIAEFLLKVFKNGNYSKIIKILNKNSNIMLSSAKHENLFIKVTDFIVSYFKSTDLRNFIMNSQIFINIFATQLDVNVVDNFIKKVKDKTDSKCVSDALLSKNEDGDNLMVILIQSEQLCTQKFKDSLNLLQKYLNDPNKLLKLLRECNNDDSNVLHVTFDLQDVTKMKIVWTELKKYFSGNLDQLRDFFMQKATKFGRNPLHCAAFCQKIDFHEALWDNLLNLYENRDELKDVVLQKNKFENNFISALIIQNKSDIVEFTFKKFDKIFFHNFNLDVFSSKGNLGRNLIQIAANASKDIKTHQLLWKFHKDFCKTDEIFLDFLKSVDKKGRNVFGIAISSTTGEIFDFMAQELEKIANREDIKNILNISSRTNKNVLQKAAQNNKSLEFHESLWKIIQKYFDAPEIVNMIEHTDFLGDNFFYYAIKCNKVEVVDFSCNQLMLSMDKSSINFSKRKLLNYSQMNKSNPEVNKWVINLLQKYNFTSGSCAFL